MEPIQSRKFIKALILSAAIWLVGGIFLHRENPENLINFVKIFLFCFLDLIFIILIFWKIFFVPKEQRGRTVQILLFVTFKLVCLGFLAITLKRLRNAPTSVILMGVGFVGIAPIIVGFFSRKKD